MAFLIGNQGVVILSEFDLSAYLDQLDPEREGEAIDVTTFTKTAREFIPGLITGNVSVAGFADPDTGAINEVLNSKVNVGGNVLTVASSRAENDDAYLAKIIQQQFNQQSSVTGAVRITGTMKPEGALDFGWLAHEPAAETTTGAGASKDGSASSAAGAVANLHMTAYAGSGTVTVIIEDSANDASWATIGTFTGLAAVGSEQISIAGTVRQYVRASWTIPGGITSVTFTVAVARL